MTARGARRATPEGLCTACSATQYCREHEPELVTLPLKATRHVLKELHGAVERLGGVRSAAKIWKVSPGHLSRVLRGDKELHDSIANYIGYWKETWWREHD